jgi:ferric-dicitrate binding protein FerR (iron transport regulator)
MSLQELRELALKWLTGMISADEKRKLGDWYDQEVPEQINWKGKDRDEDELGDRLFESIQNRIRPKAGILDFDRRLFYRAAVWFLVALGGAGLYYKFVATSPVAVSTPHKALKRKITPGSDQAVLVLDDGSEIVLGAKSGHLLTRQGKSAVWNKKNGEVVYESPVKDATLANIFNTVRTPKGGQYQVVLSDGTKVWLNAASSIRFPVAFGGMERRVILKGEAYFEVAKNPSRAFVVQSGNGMEVKVLGTHFNVMAYEDEATVETTLLEGSVQVTDQKAGQAMLRPGEQARITSGKNLDVIKTDTQQVVAWKNGYFHFNRSDIGTIMRQVARWYDVDVKYEGEIGHDQFVGKIMRTENIDEVLRILELSHVHFKVEGREITVIK